MKKVTGVKVILSLLLVVFLVLGTGLETAGRSFFGISPFIEPLTSLTRVGVYEAPYDVYEEKLIGSFGVKNHILYLTDYTKTLRILDATKPKYLREVNTLSFDYYPNILVVSDSYLFIETDNRIEIFDIIDPMKPQKIGEYTLSCTRFCYVADARIFDGLIFILFGESESFNSFPFKYSLRIIDIQSPMSPREIQNTELLNAEEVSEFSEHPDWKTNARVAFDATQDTIAISLGSDIFLFSKTTSGVFTREYTYHTSQGSSLACDYFSDLVVRKGLVYLLETYGEGIGCGKTAFRILDISGSIPKEIGVFQFPYTASDLEVQGNYAFIADRARGMRILNISEPSSLKEIAHYTRFATPLYQEIWQMKVEGDYAYVAGHQVLSRIKRIDIVDISKLR